MKKDPIESHIAAIKCGNVDKTVVTGIRKAMNALSKRDHGWQVSHTQAVMTWNQVDDIEQLLGDIKPRVVGELHDTGKALLQGKRYRRQLESVADIVADLDHFRLVGYDRILTRGGAEVVFPVYRAYDSTGKRSFPFRVIPWQSGGNGPEILSGNYW